MCLKYQGGRIKKQFLIHPLSVILTTQAPPVGEYSYLVLARKVEINLRKV